MHQIVEARVVHVLSCWCRILLEVRKLSRILSAAVNFFTRYQVQVFRSSLGEFIAV